MAYKYFSDIMHTEEHTKLVGLMATLEYNISVLDATNSQSNPGAVMELRRMKRELEIIKKILGL